MKILETSQSLKNDIMQGEKECFDHKSQNMKGK